MLEFQNLIRKVVLKLSRDSRTSLLIGPRISPWIPDYQWWNIVFFPFIHEICSKATEHFKSFLENYLNSVDRKWRHLFSRIVLTLKVLNDLQTGNVSVSDRRNIQPIIFWIVSWICSRTLFLSYRNETQSQIGFGNSQICTTCSKI